MNRCRQTRETFTCSPGVCVETLSPPHGNGEEQHSALAASLDTNPNVFTLMQRHALYRAPLLQCFALKPCQPRRSPSGTPSAMLRARHGYPLQVLTLAAAPETGLHPACLHSVAAYRRGVVASTRKQAASRREHGLRMLVLPLKERLSWLRKPSESHARNSHASLPASYGETRVPRTAVQLQRTLRPLPLSRRTSHVSLRSSGKASWFLFLLCQLRSRGCKVLLKSSTADTVPKSAQNPLHRTYGLLSAHPYRNSQIFLDK